MNLTSEGVSKGYVCHIECLSFILVQSHVDRKRPAKVMRETSFSTMGFHRDLVEFGDSAGISNITFAPGKIQS